MKVTFLGTGTSHGIPVIACGCRICLSDNPKNTRWRSSVLLESGTDAVVIDTPQEFRLQALRAGIKHLSAVCYTHGHADHIFGIDDLRVFTRGKKLLVFGDRITLKGISEKFDYIFREHCEGGGIPSLQLHDIEQSHAMLGEYRVLPVPVNHGREIITGYRAGPFAYITDCSDLPPASIEMLADLDVLVIGALRYKPHPTHYSVSQALDMIEKLSPRLAYLTHMCHDIDHEELERTLPASVRPAYDGLSIEL